MENVIDKKKDYWSWWCYRYWIHLSLCIAAVMTAVILIYWNEWSTPLKGLAAIAVILPVHVVEEWVFPGGFHYQYNLFTYNSKLPDRYPMSRLTDCITNLSGTVLFALLALWYAWSGDEVPAAPVMMTIGLCILEVIIHSIFGVMAWLRFRPVGKTTIYGVGSVTAYFCFGVLGVILSYSLAEYQLTATDWLYGALELLALLFFCIILPQEAAKNRDTRFIFPSAGYYERYVGVAENTRKMMDKKKDFWSWWCYRSWIKFSLCVTTLVTIAILIWWNEWSVPVKIFAAIGALIPIHVVEEWVFPGGFFYQYNTFAFRSDIPYRYPQNRLSDTITNLLATFLYVILALWYVLTGSAVPASVILMTIGFCILEVVIHSYFGIMAWLRFRSVGKTTIYGVGSVTAYFCFAPFGAILCYSLADYAITGSDWLYGIIELIVMLICVVVLPEQFTKSRDTRFVFPSAGYYERFLQK